MGSPPHLNPLTLRTARICTPWRAVQGVHFQPRIVGQNDLSSRIASYTPLPFSGHSLSKVSPSSSTSGRRWKSGNSQDRHANQGPPLAPGKVAKLPGVGRSDQNVSHEKKPVVDAAICLPAAYQSVCEALSRKSGVRVFRCSFASVRLLMVEDMVRTIRREAHLLSMIPFKMRNRTL